MGLTMGTGPFGKKPAGTFNFEPDPPKEHALYLEPSPRRVRGVIGGETVVDSCHVALLHETGLPADLVLPALGRPLRPARGDRSHDALPVQGRRALLDDPRGRQARREQGLGLSRDPARHARHHRPRGVLLGRRRALVRGGRGGLRPPARPVSPRRPRAELAQRAHLARRRRAGRVEPAAGLLRDQPADALVPPQGGPRRRTTRRRRAARAARTRASRRTGAWAATTTSPGATRTRSPPPRALHGLVAFYDEVVDVDLDGERQERGYSPFAPAGALKDRGVAAQVGSNA